MHRRVYRTKLKPERRDEYIRAHQNISADLMRRYSEAGMKLCAVYILGDDLVLLTEAENPEEVSRILSQDPVDREWQKHVAAMKNGEWEEMEELFLAEFSS